MHCVSQAIRTLGAGFFHDLSGQKRAKGNTYDAMTLQVHDESEVPFESGFMGGITGEDFVEQLANHGDEDLTHRQSKHCKMTLTFLLARVCNVRGSKRIEHTPISTLLKHHGLKLFRSTQ